jgi:hypothetical protein
MAAYRIWARVQRCVPEGFLAVAAAMRDEPGAGPDTRDVRMKRFGSLTACREEIGLIVHELASAVMRRGDRLVKLDVR